MDSLCNRNHILLLNVDLIEDLGQLRSLFAVSL